MKDFNLITSANHLNEYTNCQQQQQKLNKSTVDIMPIGSTSNVDPITINNNTVATEYASTRDKLMQQHTQDLTKHILNNQQQSMTLQHNYIKSFQPPSQHQHSILKQQHTAILDDRLYNNTTDNYQTGTIHRLAHHNQLDNNNIYLTNSNSNKPMINMQTLNHQYLSQSNNNQSQTNTNRLQSTFGQHHSLDLTSRSTHSDPLANSQLEHILINQQQQQRVLDTTYGLIEENNLNNHSKNLHTSNHIGNNCDSSNYAMPQLYDVVPLNQNEAANHLNQQHLHQALNMTFPSQIGHNGLVSTSNNNNCGVMTADSGIESIQSYLSQVSDHSGGNDDNSGDNGDNNSTGISNNNNTFNVDNNNNNLDESSLYHLKHQDPNQHNSQSTYNRSVIPRSNSNKILTNGKDGLFNEVGVVCSND